MSQGVHLSQKMGLAQTLSPQMQQSLALLQAPTLELRSLVEQELQQNPLLEERTEVVEESAQERLDPAEPPSDVSYDPAEEKKSEEPVDDWQAEVERIAQMDQEWRDYFSQGNLPARSQSVDGDGEKRQFLLDAAPSHAISLQESLREQVRMSELPEAQWPAAELLIGNIDGQGYLKASVDELAVSTNLKPKVIKKILAVLQLLDPPGIAARDLRECLMMQLERAEKTDSLEYRILDQCFLQLSKRRIPEIAKELGVTVEQVQDAAKRIRHLNPKPGSVFASEYQQYYVVPEVFVNKDGNGKFVVSTNKDPIPRLRINNTYRDLLSKSESSAELRQYIREKIHAGNFFIRSIHHREQTIQNIAVEIAKRQRAFFEHGVARLSPMTMGEVAEAVGVHETTVSRAVSGKYLQCSHGIFEMRFFFTSSVATASGDDVSKTTVKEMILDMIQNEDRAKPLSDEKIVKKLAQKGILVARRTVAKYRSELKILSSTLRKVY